MHMHTIERITLSRTIQEGSRTLRLLPLKIDNNFIWRIGRSSLVATKDINCSRFPTNVSLREVRLVLKQHRVLG